VRARTAHLRATDRPTIGANHGAGTQPPGEPHRRRHGRRTGAGRRHAGRTVFAHNPERSPDPGSLARHLRDAFEILEDEAGAGRICSYGGLATWTGFSHGLFTVTDLDRIATEATGTPDHHLRTIQFPVSLIEDTALSQGLRGRGPIIHAADRG
jgi:hypothetical protein